MIEFTNLSQEGFMPISRVFLTNYRKLNITMEEAMLVLHLLDHSWFGNREFPSAEYFAKKSGKSGQTVRAYLRSLSHKGYLVPIRTETGDKTYDYTPLLGSLKDLAGVPVADEEVVKPIHDQDSKVEPDPLKTLIDASLDMAKDKSKKRTPIQTKPQHWRRLQAFNDKTPEQYNAKDIEFVLALEWREKWKSPPPKFFGRDLKHAKDLISIYSPEVVTSVVKQCVKEWETIAPQFNIKGYPSMPIFWGFRNSIFPLIIDGALQTKATWGTQFDSNTDSRPEGGEIGW